MMWSEDVRVMTSEDARVMGADISMMMSESQILRIVRSESGYRRQYDDVIIVDIEYDDVTIVDADVSMMIA
jgi:hypothetical protein